VILGLGLLEIDQSGISGTESFKVVVLYSQVLPDLPDPCSPFFNEVVEAVRIIDLPHGLNYEVEGLRLAPWSMSPNSGKIRYRMPFGPHSGPGAYELLELSEEELGLGRCGRTLVIHRKVMIDVDSGIGMLVCR